MEIKSFSTVWGKKNPKCTRHFKRGKSRRDLKHFNLHLSKSTSLYDYKNHRLCPLFPKSVLSVYVASLARIMCSDVVKYLNLYIDVKDVVQ